MSDEPALETKPVKSDERGLPLWMPLLGLVAAFAAAIFIGVRIVPTLSALVVPPDPPLPPVPATLVLHEAKGSGLDEFVYSTDMSGCEVARFYEKRLGTCNYDPDSSCQVLGGGPSILPGTAGNIGTCEGKQEIGAYKLTWTVYIATNYTQGGKTRFRVIREVGN